MVWFWKVVQGKDFSVLVRTSRIHFKTDYVNNLYNKDIERIVLISTQKIFKKNTNKNTLTITLPVLGHSCSPSARVETILQTRRLSRHTLTFPPPESGGGTKCVLSPDTESHRLSRDTQKVQPSDSRHSYSPANWVRHSLSPAVWLGTQMQCIELFCSWIGIVW